MTAAGPAARAARAMHRQHDTAGSAARRGGPSGERGVALLVVLMTIALLTIVVIEFTYLAQVETHLTLSGRNALQAGYLARSGVNIAEAILIRDAEMNPTDGEGDLWAQPLPPLPVGDGTVALRVRDEARALNLNDILSAGVVRPERREVFERLFEVLGVDQRVLAAIVDWLDADDEPGIAPAGAEKTYYLGLLPPVEVRNGPLLTMRELLLVRGMTPALLATLDAFVTVLPPERLRVNVNTAPPEVLVALSPALVADPGLVDRLIAARRERAFTSKSELRDIPGLDEALGENREFVDTKSAYFRIEAVGSVHDAGRGILETVRRETGGRPRIVRVAWAPHAVDPGLTSQPASDFLEALPPLGGG
jgi:general secretion pathway protein K